MDKEKSKVIYCFSEGEFSILADVCGIRKMLCFNTKAGNDLRKLLQAEYNRTVFDLCKRGVISRNENKLVLGKQIATMITRCGKSKKIICFRKRSEQVYTACFYFDDGMNYSLILPGRRNSEYIRISSHMESEMFDMLECYMSDGDEAYIYDGGDLQKLCVLNREMEDKYSVEELIKHIKGE